MFASGQPISANHGMCDLYLTFDPLTLKELSSCSCCVRFSICSCCCLRRSTFWLIWRERSEITLSFSSKRRLRSDWNRTRFKGKMHGVKMNPSPPTQALCWMQGKMQQQKSEQPAQCNKIHQLEQWFFLFSAVTTCGDTMWNSLNWVVISSEEYWRLDKDSPLVGYNMCTHGEYMYFNHACERQLCHTDCCRRLPTRSHLFNVLVLLCEAHSEQLCFHLKQRVILLSEPGLQTSLEGGKHIWKWTHEYWSCRDRAVSCVVLKFWCCQNVGLNPGLARSRHLCPWARHLTITASSFGWDVKP